MSTSVRLQESPGAWEPPSAKPLDEAVWQAWVLKGRAQDANSRAAFIKAAKWLSIAGLLLAAVGLWPHLALYDVVARFILAGGALVMVFEAFHVRQYAFAAAFGFLVLLYNPLAPVFSFSGAWQVAVIVASTVPFAASLTWRTERLAHNG